MNDQQARKTVRTFALASFLNDLGSDMYYPIWPLFVTSVLGANMAVLGLIDGLGDALVALSQAGSGYISDRIRKRKIFVWTGYLMGSLARIGYALTSTWPQLIPLRILERAGKMRGSPRDAIIADVSTDCNRGKNFGILRMMDNLGAVVGIIVCILFFKALGYERLFLLAGIPSLIGAVLILAVIKERKSSDIKIYKGLSFKQLSGNFKLFLALSAVFALGSFSYSFLLIFAERAGFKTIFVPVLYLLFTAVASIFSLPFGKLADRIGRKTVMIFSFIFWGIVCLGSIAAQSHWVIVTTFIFYGLHRAALEPVQRTFVAELAPAEYRASSLGGYQMVIGLCALPASLGAGLLWDKIGIRTPFMISLGLTIVAVVMLLFVKEPRAQN